MVNVLRQDLLPASGVEFATHLRLTPSCLVIADTERAPDALTPRLEFVSRVLCNLVVARSNLLRIFEVREEPSVLSQQQQQRERRGERRGTEAVEGEVEMDRQGDGFINISGELQKQGVAPTQTRLYLIREHALHGTVTGLSGVRISSSKLNGLDRLLVSFKDAKVALLEWSDHLSDLAPVSIHTYERAPHLLTLSAPTFVSTLRVDPLSRCAALSLPNGALAVLPFVHSDAHDVDDPMDLDLDVSGSPLSRKRKRRAVEQVADVDQMPYAPSYILDLAFSVHASIRNIIDTTFLPGFHSPTLAVLYQDPQTCTARLGEYKDTVKLIIFTLDTTGKGAAPTRYPIIKMLEGLPYDSTTLIPCPAFGGVVVITSNSVLYTDQSASSRVIALPVNGWAGRVSDLPLIETEATLDLSLEGAKAVFVDEKTLLLTLATGAIYPVTLVTAGKTVTSLSIGEPIAQTTIPTLALALKPTSSPVDGEDSDNLVFVGSTAGPAVLLRTRYVEEEVLEDDTGNAEIAQNAAKSAVVEPDVDMEDDFYDLYGPSAAEPAPQTVTSEVKPKKTRRVLQVGLRDSLPSWGPISSIGFSLSCEGDRAVPELVAATGTGGLGGFTLFQRDLPTRTRKKLLALGGTRGLWSLPIRQGLRGGAAGSNTGASANVDAPAASRDTLILSTDAAPSPGVSRIAVRSAMPSKSTSYKNDRDAQVNVQIQTRIGGTTVGAAPFFGGTAILVVMTGAIKVLEPDGTERQTILDLDGKLSRPRIRHCSICDPFVLIIREDDSIGLFIGEVERGKIRRKDMSAMGEKTSKYLAGCFFSDTTGLFADQHRAARAADAAGAPASVPATTTLQNVVNASGASGKGKTQWLLLVRPQGIMEIWALPKLALVFSSPGLSSLENVLSDSGAPPALSTPAAFATEATKEGQDASEAKVSANATGRREPQEFDVEQILLAGIGEGRVKPHLCVFLRSGQLTVYEGLPLLSPSVTPPATADDSASNTAAKRNSTLSIKFVKISSMAFEIYRAEEGDEGVTPAILAEQRKVQRGFVPFVTSPRTASGAPGPTYQGVFFTGDRPNWILGTDRGGLHIFPSGHAVVNAFTPCSIWDERGDFLMYTEDGPRLLEWLPDFSYENPLPSRAVPRGRPYTNVVFDPSTCLVVAASSLKAKFASYDEEGERVWESDAPNVSDPLTDTSALELISPNNWVTMDGFEFATNEYINDIAIVTLETAATETGSKDFIAVGTTIDRGEDLAAKGAAYIFEIVEVVPDPAVAPTRWYKLRLRCRDDAKGPVTAVCGFQGYLVSSMGQKIFVRAFDSDERLVGVAFLDVGIYVTSLRVLKNLLLIGDAVKSIMFVVFQEDPYKLVLLAKDVELHSVASADFFFDSDGELALITGDEEGVMRIYEYNPQDPDSRDGRYLLLRTEYHGQVEYRTSVTIARRDKDDPSIPRSQLLIGSADGSLSSLTPVDEHAFKRLQLLQGQLTRNIQHVAGLNPKAFRIVKNDYVSKPLSKGILDGTLLAHYESLPIPRQKEMTKQIGTDRVTLLRDWIGLTGPW